MYQASSKKTGSISLTTVQASIKVSYFFVIFSQLSVSRVCFMFYQSDYSCVSVMVSAKPVVRSVFSLVYALSVAGDL